MALDEPKETDEKLSSNGFDVVIEKSLLGQLGGVTIDYQTNRWMGSGFQVSPTYKFSGGVAEVTGPDVVYCGPVRISTFKM